MLKSFIKIALRNMWRQKGYTFINVIGLAVGTAACILILLFVQDELSYDKYHDKSDRMYRVSRQWFNQDGETSLHLGHVAPPFGPLIKNDFDGEVLETVRFLNDDPLITYEQKKIEEERFFFVDGNVFEIFSWQVLEGDPKTALLEPNSIVMTRSTAEKYFDDADAIGKTINYDNQVDMKVTAIVEDVPLNSHFKFDMLCSFQTVEDFVGLENLMQRWGSNNYSTFILFPEGADITAFENKLPAFLDKHLGPNRDGTPASRSNKLNLMPLTDIHLHSHLDSEIEANSDIAYVYIYTIIAFFILIIACINFMNLATARSAKRAKEVGLRKVMGAYRSVLIKQFISESVLFAIFSLIVAVVLVGISLPVFNDFVGKDLSLNIVNNTFLLVLLVGIALFVGLAAGSYPAFFLSAFQPAAILKGNLKLGNSNISLRSVLVVVQFTISITLIVSVGIVQDQLKYVRNKALGFDKENMLVLPISNEIYQKYESVKNQLLEQPGITTVTLSSRIPSGRLLDSQGATAEVDGEMKQIRFRIADIHIDHDYLNSFGVKFIAGRNFDINRTSDSTEAFILNKAALSAIGWKTAEEAIDKEFQYGMRKGNIIGVVDDFHFESLHQTIAPMVFLITSGRARSIAVRVKNGFEDETLAYLNEQWSYLRPGFPFTYFWVDQRFSEQYTNEDKLAKVVRYFSALAIIIASLGLFGLASFTAEQRFKEIGIRKVLGASVGQILMLLTKGFTRLVIIAFIIACPLAWYFMDGWLENFAYQTDFNLLTFAIGGLIAAVIAWLTVSYQSVKAARVNPVESIRQE
ncbi:ABC transporter permease [Fulvivirgaceae bacterium BMA10]|uniref:ABC transporter permease n=1 Tax=Splendidivirga corallicola TaxID=3051826 RepID=A0ABT8KM94_9BACT|nr:ABC transporter permease [Fulvivirgaceae bacterium BMA10]